MELGTGGLFSRAPVLCFPSLGAGSLFFSNINDPLIVMFLRVVRCYNYKYLLRLCMLDGTAVLRVNFPLIGTIYLQISKFVTSV